MTNGVFAVIARSKAMWQSHGRRLLQEARLRDLFSVFSLRSAYCWLRLMFTISGGIGYQMKICEIFTSIQGESTFAGLPCTFIRLSGCNLRCVYCDTKYSYDEGDEMQPGDILQRVDSAGVRLVEITGGEPMLQGKETTSLIRELLDKGYEVLVETNGSINIRELDKRGPRSSLDMKTPGSAMSDKMDLTNLELIKNLR